MRQRRRITLALPLLALMVGAAACSSAGGGDEGVATASGAQGAATTTPVDGLAEWAACMRDQGIDIPDPGPDGKLDGGPEAASEAPKGSPQAEAAGAAYDAAEEVCGLIDDFSGDTSEPMSSADVEQWTEWAQCMRDNGIDMNDPDPSVNAPPVPNETSELDPMVFRTAEEACADRAPTDGDRSRP